MIMRKKILLKQFQEGIVDFEKLKKNFFGKLFFRFFFQFVLNEKKETKIL